MKQRIALLLALALGAAACGSGGAGASTPSAAATLGPTSDGAPVPPILDTWRREQTCEELVRAFTAAGIEDLIPEGIEGMNLRSDPREVIARDKDACRGATPRERTFIFRENGYLQNFQGDQLADDCRCYTLVGDHTLVALGAYGDPDISMRYTIRGGMVSFKVQIPDPCSTALCRDQVAWVVAQYGLGPWERIE